MYTVLCLHFVKFYTEKRREHVLKSSLSRIWGGGLEKSYEAHGSRLWPCGCCRRRGEIVGAGSLGMVRPCGSPLGLPNRVEGEMEFPRVPSGTTPLPQVWGPAQVAPRKSAHAWAGSDQKLAREVTHAQRWHAKGGVRLGLGVDSLPPPSACGA